MDDDPTLDPTPQRRERARAEGRFARGRMLGGVMVLCGGLAMVQHYQAAAATCMGHMLRTRLEAEAWIRLTPGRVQDVGRDALREGLQIVWPPMLGCLVIAVGVNLVQSGGLWLPEKLRPDLQRLHPGHGWRRLCTADRMADGGWYLAMLSAGLGGGAAALGWHASTCFEPHENSLGSTTITLMAALPSYALTVAAGLLPVAIAEYAYQRWRFERSLRMSLNEAREELRGREGDVRVRSLRKAAHDQIVRRQPPSGRHDEHHAAARFSQ